MYIFHWTDPLGRKRSMILVNIPFAIGWYMLYRATAVWEIFFGFAMQGLAIGLMEAPIVTYLGEIWWDFLSNLTSYSFAVWKNSFQHISFTLFTLVDFLICIADKSDVIERWFFLLCSLSFYVFSTTYEL